MIDTDKYEGCQDHALTLYKGLLCPTILMDVDGSGKIVPTLDRGIVDVQADIPDHYLLLLRDAPLLLEEVKRLREENETLRKMDWEYECLWTWLAENTNLLNTIEPLMEEWKKEMIE